MRKFIFVLMVSVVSFIFAVSAVAEKLSAPKEKAAARKNLIVNGGFEEGKDPGGFSVEGVGSKNIADWNIAKGTVDYIGGYFRAHEGKRCIDMDGTPGPGEIQQTFQTTPGAKYLVTFALEANRQGPPDVKKLKVSAAGQSKTFSFNVKKEKKWKLFRWEFTAKKDRTTISFSSLSNKGNIFGALLDDVSVLPVE